MALTQTWVLQGVTPTTIDATDSIAFSDGTFGNPIIVGSYNDGTHVRSNAAANDSSANTPNNVKFISQSGGTGGDSQADWGDGTEDLDAMTTAEATLKLTVAYDSNITISSAIMYAYDGTTPATAPTGMDVYLAEQADTNWTNADGSAAALALGDKSTPATSHDYYIAVSTKPTTVGVKDANKLRIEFTYQ